MIANSPDPAAVAKLGARRRRVTGTPPHVVAVMAIGAGLVVAIAGVGVIAAVGKTVPTQLWDVITSLSAALLGMLMLSPAQRRALKVQQHVSADPKVQDADRVVHAASVEVNRATDEAKQADAEAAQAEDALAQAPADDGKQDARDKAVENAQGLATRAKDAQGKHVAALLGTQQTVASATKTAEAETGRTPDWRIIIALVLAIVAAAVAAWLYASPGQDSQCLASVGTLTTTVVQPAPSTGKTTSTTASSGAPANTVTNVSTVTIGQIATPHPTSTSGGAAVPAGTPQILKTATGSSAKCPAVVTGDALLAVALGLLAAILGILVPSVKLPETAETPTT